MLVAASILVCAPPAISAAEHMVQPRTREEIKPSLEFLIAHWQRGDTLYVDYGAQYAFRYYGECDCFDLSDLRTYRKELDPLLARSRLWVLFTHARPGSPSVERKVTAYLACAGREVHSRRYDGSTVALFEARSAAAASRDLCCAERFDF